MALGITVTTERHNRESIAYQQNKQKLSCGFHYGQLNPIPSNWYFPQSFPIIYLLNMWLQSDALKNIPPLRLITSSNDIPFQCGKNKLSKMWQVIKVVSKYVKEWKYGKMIQQNILGLVLQYYGPQLGKILNQNYV